MGYIVEQCRKCNIWGVDMKFKERLEELLKENGLNRLKLANKIGVTSTTINGYFNDNYYPRIDIAVKMAREFNCSLDYLFGLDDDNFDGFVLNNENTFIENFDHLLKQNHLAIANALKQMNLGEYDYYRWKKGMFPKTTNLIVIANFFGVSLDMLVGATLKN